VSPGSKVHRPDYWGSISGACACRQDVEIQTRLARPDVAVVLSIEALVAQVRSAYA
jgi:hypothetical protein